MSLTRRDRLGIALATCLLVAGAYRALHLYTPTASVEVSVGTAEIDQARKVLKRALAGDTTGWAGLSVDSAATASLIDAGKQDAGWRSACMQRAPAALSFHRVDTATVSWSPRATQHACAWLANVNVTLVGAPGDAHLVRISGPRLRLPAAGDCLPNDGGPGFRSALGDVRCAAPDRDSSLDARLLSTSEREWSRLSPEMAEQLTQTITAAFIGRGAKGLDCPASSMRATGRIVRGLWQYQEYAVALTEAPDTGATRALRLAIKPLATFQCNFVLTGRP